MKKTQRPVVFALCTSAITLALWPALGIGANFGLYPMVAVAGLLWLPTVGLPTSLGVVLAATLWGRFEPLTGLYGYLALAAGLGVAFQVIAGLALSRGLASARASGRPRQWRRTLAGAAVFAGFAPGFNVAVISCRALVARPPSRMYDRRHPGSAGRASPR